LKIAITKFHNPSSSSLPRSQTLLFNLLFRCHIRNLSCSRQQIYMLSDDFLIRFELMGHNNTSSLLNNISQTINNNLLGVRVQRAGTFIHDQNLWILNQSSSNNYSLSLASRKGHTLLSNLGIISLRLVHDEIMGICKFSSPYTVFL